MIFSNSATSALTPANSSDRHRVLFIPAWYPTLENPIAAKFVRDHARAASIYDDVTVLHVQLTPLFAGSGPSWREGLEDGIPIIRLRVPNLKGISYMLSVVGAYQRLRFRGYRPDVIHAHIYHAGLPGALISKLYRVPLVTTEHWTGFPMRELSPGDSSELGSLTGPPSTCCRSAIRSARRWRATGSKRGSESFPIRSIPSCSGPSRSPHAKTLAN